MSAAARDSPNRPMIVVDGRVLGPGSYRPSSVVDLEDSPAWWGSLSVLGGLLVVAGTLLGAQRGEISAVGGTALFLLTAVLAGVERTELATATGIAGIVWLAGGISVVLGTSAGGLEVFAGFAVVGGACVALGILGSLRSRRRLDSPG